MLNLDSQNPFSQCFYLIYELKCIVNNRWWRWLTCWFSSSTGVIVSYRIDRFGFLLFRRAWPILRLFVMPIFWFLRLLGANHEIHYSADIGPGLKVLHGSLGVVVSGVAVAGRHLTLTGGNCIGKCRPMKPGELVLGDDVELGVNAVILDPLQIGNHVQIGAGSVVIADAPDTVVLAGVPARIIKYQDCIS